MKKIISPLISLIYIVFSTSIHAIEARYFDPNIHKQVLCVPLESSEILLKKISCPTSELWKPPKQEMLYVSFNREYEHRIILDRIKMCLFIVNINSEILYTSPISSKGIRIEFNHRNTLILENVKNINFTRINEISTKKITIAPSTENVCRVIGAADYRELVATSNLPKNNLISISIVDDKFHIMS